MPWASRAQEKNLWASPRFCYWRLWFERALFAYLTAVKLASICVLHLARLYAILTFAGLDFCMHSQEGVGSVRENIAGPRIRMTVLPGSSMLRQALRRNIVSFPAQIPVLLKQPSADPQWRMVLLYFVRGWSQTAIAARLGVPVHRISRTLNEWSIRALAYGYVQVVDSEECGRLGIECESDAPAEEIHTGAGAAVVEIAPARPDGADLLASLDAAITHCGRWRGEFWAGATALLTDLRTAAAVAVESGRIELHPREKERVSHAVA